VSAAPLANGAAVRQRAVDIAGKNKCLGEPVAVDGQAEVEIGQWDPVARVFTVTDGKVANAVRVTARRTAGAHGGIPLLLPRVVGFDDVDVSTRATAYVTRAHMDLGIIGLQFVRMNGNGYVDSYDGAAGPWPGAGNANASGNVASNGDIQLIGSVQINGDARPGIGHTVSNGGVGKVTGWEAPLDWELDFPLPVPPADITADSNDNAELVQAGVLDAKGVLSGSSPGITIPGGTPGNPKRYYVSALTIGGNGALTFGANVEVYVHGSGGVSIKGTGSLTANGPLQIWSDGDVDLGGNMAVTAGSASDISISVTSPGTTVRTHGNTTVSARIMAPQSDMKMDGDGDFFGNIVAGSLTVSGNGGIHFDESYWVYYGPWVIQLVQ
jgi:hypothetical protein